MPVLTFNASRTLIALKNNVKELTNMPKFHPLVKFPRNAIFLGARKDI